MKKLANSFVKKVLFLVVLSLQSFVAFECFAIDQDATTRQLTLEDVQQIVESAKQSEEVDLDVLKELDADTAHVIAASRGKLFLNGLTELTPEVAEILATHRGWLHLGGLRSISPAVARALSKHQGWLFLNGFRFLERDVALALLPYPGQLYLEGGLPLAED